MKKNIFLLLFLVLAIACNEKKSKSKIAQIKKTISSKNTERKKVNFSEKSLITFMDSVKKLLTDSLVKQASFYADSIFLDIQQINRKLDKLDFEALKTAIKKKSISIDQAEKIFGKIELDSIYLGKKNIPVKFYAFDKESRNDQEFAISFNEERFRGKNSLYFFNADSLLAKKKYIIIMDLSLTIIKIQMAKP